MAPLLIVLLSVEAVVRVFHCGVTFTGLLIRTTPLDADSLTVDILMIVVSVRQSEILLESGRRNDTRTGLKSRLSGAALSSMQIVIVSIGCKSWLRDRREHWSTI